MAVLKIKEVGDSATLKMTRCEVVDGTYGEQVKFTADNGDVVFMPRASADRQLVRCGFGEGSETDGYTAFHGDVDGHILTISRAENKTKGAKPYWAISLAGTFDMAPTTPSKRLTGPNDPRPVAQLVPPTAPPPDDGDFQPDDAMDFPFDGEQALSEAGTKAAVDARAIETAYLALFDRVVEHISSRPALTTAGTLALLAQAQAVTATIWISRKERGLT